MSGYRTVLAFPLGGEGASAETLRGIRETVGG